MRLEADFEREPPLDLEERALWLLGLGPTSREVVMRVSQETGYSVNALAWFISCFRARVKWEAPPRSPVVWPRTHPHLRWPVPPRVIA